MLPIVAKPWLHALTLLVAIAIGAPCAPSWAAASGEKDEASGAAAQGATRETPVASAVRLEIRGDTTVLSFAMSELVNPHAFVLADPDRVIVDLPEVNFQIPPESVRRPKAGGKAAASARPVGVIRTFRFGLFAPGKSRIVVDLAQPARIVRAALEPGEDGGARVVLELVRSDRAAFVASAARETAVAAPVPSAVSMPAGDLLPLVALDAGHGGIDTGAHGPNGILEKDVVFDFTHALAERLEASGRYRVLLTRSSDVFVPLGERVNIARAAGAALFMSIHADMLPDDGSVGGATVYTVSDKASDATAARLAETENQADAAAGLEGREDQSEINDILFDLTRRETRAFSHVFARTLVEYFKVAGRLNKNPRRSAGFRVLKAPDVPSVLLELGYLSNDRDTRALTSPEWRERSVKMVGEAIDKFFEPRGKGSSGVTAQRAVEFGPAKASATLPN